MERWQWCQAIEAAGGFQSTNWTWLSQAPDEFPALGAHHYENRRHR